MKLVELVPDWGESLAVATPRGEEVDEPGSVREELGATLSEHIVIESFLVEKIWNLTFVGLVRFVTHWKRHPRKLFVNSLEGLRLLVFLLFLSFDVFWLSCICIFILFICLLCE